MSEAKFTKGEWSQSHRKQLDGMYSTQVYDDKGKTICTLSWHIAIDKEPGAISTDRDANAHLIATAPEMYNEIQEFIDSACEEDIENARHRFKQILAKARGES